MSAEQSRESLTASNKNLTKDIWSLIKEQKERKNVDGMDRFRGFLTWMIESVESYLFVAGGSGSGKSTITAKFLDKGIPM
jgi:hypothetical protein